jgi:hypothetical protein
LKQQIRAVAPTFDAASRAVEPQRGKEAHAGDHDAGADGREDAAGAARAIEHGGSEDHENAREAERREHDENRPADAAAKSDRLEARRHRQPRADGHEAEEDEKDDGKRGIAHRASVNCRAGKA